MAQDRQPKTLVLCFDGTTNQFSDNNTHVVKLYAMLSKDSPSKQVTYYQPGVGTYFEPGVMSPLLQWAGQLMDYAVAWYLYQHIIDGYRFIINNYETGDRICVFGFSRGAYTARCVAGMVAKIGVMSPQNEESLPYAYKLYSRTDSEGMALAAGFKRTYSRHAPIEFVGVWDTVASVGVILRRDLPFTASNTSIRTFRHALSLDERRVRFQPNVYHRPAPTPEDAKNDPNHASSVPAPGPLRGVTSRRDILVATDAAKRKSKDTITKLYDIWNAGIPVSPAQKIASVEAPNGPVAPVEGSGSYEELDDEGTNVYEVWFSGTHSDVGGGAVLDTETLSLGDISLRWMVKEIIKTDPGIIFNPGALEALLGPNLDGTSGAAHGTHTPSDLDVVDAMAPVHDSLKEHPIWWILELLPLSHTWQDDRGVWRRQWRCNLGRGRRIEETPNIHHTVQQRIEDPKLRYKPNAVYKQQNWV